MALLQGMRVLVITAIIVALDQTTKLMVKASFFLGESMEVLGNLLRFTYIENPGMAFGIRIGGKYFFTVFAAIATVVIMVYLYRIRREKLPARLSLALILGGAIGNLIDRFAYGSVIDFIDVGINNTRWPVFNIADSAVSIGMVILVALVLFEKEKTAAEPESPALPPTKASPSDEHDNWLDTRTPTPSR